MRNAAIIVDVQNDFCPGGALAVPRGDQIIPLVNRILDYVPISVLTQDWHPEKHISFASSHGMPEYVRATVGGRSTLLWPDHCVAGRPGADFHPALASHKARLVLRKGTREDLDSYSAFFENDGCTSTGLAGYLRDLGVGILYLCGLATDYCVLATAIDARTLGFDVILITDATQAVEATTGDNERALLAMKAAGCVLSPFDEVFSDKGANL